MNQKIELTYEQEDKVVTEVMKDIYEGPFVDLSDLKYSKKIKKAAKRIHNYFSKPEDWIK